MTSVVPDAEQRLTALAEAVADGRLPDWDSAESDASDETERQVQRHLRAIAAIGRLQTGLSFDTALPGAGPTLDSLSAILEVPTTWGSLRVVERIGRGRFGDVYRAWDPSLDREVALKLLRRQAKTEDPGDMQVIGEGRLMARVRHPNVVTIYGAQRIEGRTGLWMELIQGRTLEAELADRGHFNAADISRVGIELCRALDAVHRAGLVHRDVKAQNVLQEATGRIVLGDFGTGLELDEAEVEPASIAGTPAYLAPEIFRRSPATASSDLYSLGALLFHLASGTYPVEGRSFRDLRNAHARGERTTLRARRPDLPDALLTAIDTSLDPDPSRRFASASAMEAALAPPRPTAGGRARAGWMLAGAFGALIATVSAGAAWLSSSRDNRRTSGAVPLAAGSESSRTFRQISRDPMLAGPGAPSPDGRLLSFVDDNGDLAIHDIATGKRWPVTGNRSVEKATGLAETSQFTGDGTHLFYVWYTRDWGLPEGQTATRESEIRMIPSGGGESRLVWRDPRRSDVQLRHWSGDDRYLLVNLWTKEEWSELAVISTDDGSIRTTHRVGRLSPDGASLSPDGRYIVFDRPDPETRLRDIFVVDIDGGSETPLVRHESSDHTPAWTRDGRHVLFLSDRSGTTGLWAQRVDAGRTVGLPVRLEPTLGWAFPMGQATDDGAYFFRRQIGARDVYTVDLDASGAIAGEPVRVSTAVAGANGASDWSPDGTRLTFFRRRDDRWSLVIKSMVDGREREISNPHVLGIGRPRWEPDGSSILFKANYRERSGLHRVNVETGAITTVTSALFGHYDIVPNTREIIYVGEPSTFYRYNVVTGVRSTVHQIERPWISTGFAISPDGDRLVYSANHSIGVKAQALRLIDLHKPDKAIEVYRAAQGEEIQAFAWMPGGREVIIKRVTAQPGKPGDRSRLWAIDVATGTARLLGLEVSGLNQVRLSPDGRRLSFDGGWPVQEVWALENFLAALDGR